MWKNLKRIAKCDVSDRGIKADVSDRGIKGIGGSNPPSVDSDVPNRDRSLMLTSRHTIKLCRNSDYAFRLV